MTCPECGELLEHNECPECGYEPDPDVDAAYDQMKMKNDGVRRRVPSERGAVEWPFLYKPQVSPSPDPHYAGVVPRQFNGIP